MLKYSSLWGGVQKTNRLSAGEKEVRLSVAPWFLFQRQPRRKRRMIVTESITQPLGKGARVLCPLYSGN